MYTSANAMNGYFVSSKEKECTAELEREAASATEVEVVTDASDTQADETRTSAFAAARRYAIAAALFAAGGIVYEQFSHDVFSPFMVFAFAVPLVLGALPMLVAGLRRWRLPKVSITSLYGAGVFALTVGSVMKGVLDIYGTTNGKIVFYLVAGIAAIATALIWAAIERRKQSDEGSAD